MRCLLILLLFALTCPEARAQGQQLSAEKIETLTKLLQDPDVQAWLTRVDERGSMPPPPATSSMVPTFSAWEINTRTRVKTAINAIPRVPGELTKAAKRVREDAVSHGYAPVLVLLVGLITVGLIGEKVYRRVGLRGDGVIASMLPIVVFATSMFGPFFAIDWPPLARITLFVYLTAFVSFRLVSEFLRRSNPKGGRIRIRILAGIVIVAVANSILWPLVGVDPTVIDAASYVCSFALLGFWLEAIWSVREGGVSRRLALMAAAAFVWLLATWEVKQMKIFVFGGVSASADPELVNLGERVGSGIAVAGHTILCGGRADGIIGSAIDAAISEGCSIVGLVDHSAVDQPRLNRGIKNVQRFATREERRDYLNEAADAFVALPGGFGTLSELTDIIERRRESSNHKPLILLGPERFWHGVEVLVDSMYSAGLISLKDRSLFRYAKTTEQAIAMMNVDSMPSP